MKRFYMILVIALLATGCGPSAEEIAEATAAQSTAIASDQIAAPTFTLAPTVAPVTTPTNTPVPITCNLPGQVTVGDSAAAGHNTSDPDAIENASILLHWLYTLSERQEHRVLAGQHIGNKDGPQGYDDYAMGLYRRTGELPALIGVEYDAGVNYDFFIDRARKTDILARHWNAGGLVTVSESFANPWEGQSVHTLSRGDGTYADAYTPGTEAYTKLKADFDVMADEFLSLQDQCVVILWRPFHEANQSHWWHTSEPEEFKQLWRFWHSYLTENKGVHNLLFVYSPSSRSLDDQGNQTHNPLLYYPGDEYVDVTALDLYSDNFQDMPQSTYQDMLALGKPFGFGELGAQLPPTESNREWSLTHISEAMEELYPEAVFWLSWSNWWPYGIMAMESLPDAELLLNHPLVATLKNADTPHSVVTSEIVVIAHEYTGEEISVGIIMHSNGHVVRHPDVLETGIERLSETSSDSLRIVPVRSVETYRLPRIIQRLIEEEHSSFIILEVDSDSAQDIEDAARKYPDTTFIISPGVADSSLSNVVQYGLNAKGWYYLTGLIAGSLTETDRIGYWAYSDADWSIERANEFGLGVSEVNPEAEVIFLVNTGDIWHDIEVLIAEGCDAFNAIPGHNNVLFNLSQLTANGTELITFSIEASRDEIPGTIALGQPEDLGLIWSRIIQDVLNGNSSPENIWTGIRDGVIRLGSGSPPMDPLIQADLEDIQINQPSGGTISAYDFVQMRFRQLQDGEYELPHLDSSSLQSPFVTLDPVIIELGGVWEGVTTNDFLIIFDINSSCYLNEICGSFEIPNFSLTGEIIFTKVKGNEYVFQVTNLSSDLTGNPYESLTLLDDGTLKYYTTDYTTENEAILVKK